MPPITILSYEPDDEGGWYVWIRDESNLDGLPLEGMYHVDDNHIDELRAERARREYPENKLLTARNQVASDKVAVSNAGGVGPGGGQRDILNIPPGITPYAIRDWLEGYEEHISVAIEKWERNIHGGAPYWVLEDDRLGLPIPERWVREHPDLKTQSGIEEFAARNIQGGPVQ